MMVATADAEDKTTGGVLLPSSAQRKPTSGQDADLYLIARIMCWMTSCSGQHMFGARRAN